MAPETSRETNLLPSEKPPSSPLMAFADSRRLFSMRPFSNTGETIKLEVASTPSEEREPLWGGGHSWLNPCTFLVFEGEAAASRLPSCMFWLQWPGDSPDHARDPKVGDPLL